MRSARLVPFRIFSLFLFLLLTLFTANVLAYADDEDEGETYEEKARVVRISLLKGEVTLKRQSNADWERADLNFPLVEGDSVATIASRNWRYKLMQEILCDWVPIQCCAS